MAPCELCDSQVCDTWECCKCGRPACDSCDYFCKGCEALVCVKCGSDRCVFCDGRFCAEHITYCGSCYRHMCQPCHDGDGHVDAVA